MIGHCHKSITDFARASVKRHTWWPRKRFALAVLGKLTLKARKHLYLNIAFFTVHDLFQAYAFLNGICGETNLKIASWLTTHCIVFDVSGVNDPRHLQCGIEAMYSQVLMLPCPTCLRLKAGWTRVPIVKHCTYRYAEDRNWNILY